MRDVKGDIKGFSQYNSSKWKARDNMDLLLNGAGALVTDDTKLQRMADMPEGCVTI